MSPVLRADLPLAGMPSVNSDISDDDHQNTRQQVILLTGAPDSAKIDWATSSLYHEFCGRIRRFLQSNPAPQETIIPQATSDRTTASAKWRAVPLNPSTFSGADLLSFQDDAERSEFLEHTLTTVLDAFPGGDGGDHPGETSMSSESFTSIISTEMSLSTSSDDTSCQAQLLNSEATTDQTVNFNGAIHDLKQIPSARYIQSIQPQTMTLDLLVGVISVETRTVKLRTRDIEMELMEVLVGDDTATPFKTTFWLPVPATSNPTREASSTDTARTALYALRAGDVVLVNNVALHVFKGVVYGQSLPRRLTSHATRVTILTTRVLGLSAAAMVKLDRVRSWTREFVGLPKLKRATDREDERGAKRARYRAEEEKLPDDTPLDL